MRFAERIALLVLTVVVLHVCGIPLVCANAPPNVPDSLYNSHHPRLLFTAAELPALRVKVVDGGYDDDAFAYLRFLAQSVYPGLPPASILNPDFGINAIPNLGVAGFLESPINQATLDVGRDAIVYLAENYDVDGNEAESGLRLRSLVMGYDMFFSNAPESTRTAIRDEIVDYVERMVTSFVYELFAYRPYTGNHGAMFAGPLGMAAICLQDEADSLLLADALGLADRVIDSLLTYQFDPDGAYKEGCLYAGWTMRQLAYYFDARRRFDGFDYGSNPKIRNMARWLSYELLPEGGAATNNLNDSPYNTIPLARNNTYASWAQSAWQSGLAAWLWEHTAGPFGIDLGMNSDKAATALWNQNITPIPPESMLPKRWLFFDRGLYYFRSGWQLGPASGDVVFSFYSGKFHGAHAQEDQNQFTLYGYGQKFAVDHGTGTAKNSEAHNMVFIDGAGQHNAGSSIGTDGRIAEHLLSGFGDYLLGDATLAYTTHSQFNDPDWPFPGFDWSWGYSGANPVLHAHRRVVVVHDGTTPPYVVIDDDIDKDGMTHAYQWRLHTSALNNVDTSGNPIVVSRGGGSMDVFVVNPDPSQVSVATSFYNNQTSEPDATLLTFDVSAVNPYFCMLLLPTNAGGAPLLQRGGTFPWGSYVVVDWGGLVRDVVISNHSGALVCCGPDSIRTDARLAVVRTASGVPTGYLLDAASGIESGGREYAYFYGGVVDVALCADTITVNRDDLSFRILDTGIERIAIGDEEIPFVRAGGFLIPDSPVAIGGEGRPVASFGLSVYPNPANPEVTIRLELSSPGRVTILVYDATGRRVGRVLDERVDAGSREFRWEPDVPSGVYFVAVDAGGESRVAKLTLVR